MSRIFIPVLFIASLSVTAARAAQPGAAPDAEKPRLVVLGLSPAGGVEPEIAQSLTEAVTAEIAARGLFQVISASEVQTLLGFERQKQLLGCSEEGECLTELAGALGARFVLSGSIARLGSTYQLNLQTLDSSRAAPLGRATRIFDDLGALRAQLAWTVAEATGTPLPPPPSRVLPYTLMATGAAAVLAGGGVGLLALNQEAAIQRELTTGQNQPLALQPMEAYRAELGTVGLQRTWSLVGMTAGAALIVGGILLNPGDPLAGARAQPLTLTVSGNGLGLAGLWP